MRDDTDIPAMMAGLGARAKAAAADLAFADPAAKTRALEAAADAVAAREAEILAANGKDMAFGRDKGLSPAMLDRLKLDGPRIAGIVAGLRAVAAQPDPVGRVMAEWDMPSGLNIRRVRTPLGVIGVIYESRPNVTADAGALCLKAGNAVILRGGSESFHSSGALHACLVEGLRAAGLPEDAILTNGAGNYAAFLHRYFAYRGHGTQLAPTSGSMGYGFPAAISAKLEHPGRPVICLAGDGCFQMTLNEMSTAVQHGANVVVIVANNGRYGTIRMHQERTYPGRVSGTDLVNPDYPALARAYGGDGVVVADQAEFPAAMARAMAAATPFVVELRLDPEALATGFTLAEARAMGEAR